MSRIWRTIQKKLLYAFFPNRCPLCDEVISFSEHICEKCKEDTVLYEKEGAFSTGKCDAVVFCFAYEGKGKESVWRLKYEERLDVAIHLAWFLKEQCEQNLPQLPDLIIPVPMSKIKREERGYNQAEVLAKELAEYWRLPMKNALICEHRSSEQHTLSRNARRHAVKGRYWVDPPKGKLLAGKRVLLVDDVYTTGSTAEACAQVLKDAGADKVFVATVCRTFRKE